MENTKIWHGLLVSTTDRPAGTFETELGRVQSLIVLNTVKPLKELAGDNAANILLTDQFCGRIICI